MVAIARAITVAIPMATPEAVAITREFCILILYTTAAGPAAGNIGNKKLNRVET